MPRRDFERLNVKPPWPSSLEQFAGLYLTVRKAEFEAALTVDTMGHRDQRTTKRFFVRPNAVRQTQDLSHYFEKRPVSGTETETLPKNEESRNDVSRYGSKYTRQDSNLRPPVS